MKHTPEFNAYLFDLDGTLINTVDLIVHCFEHSLKLADKNLKIEPQEIKKHVGLPLKDQMKIYLGHLPEVDYEDIMKKHMDYQVKIWRDHVKVYPGVKKTLDFLQQNQKEMAIVTSRRQATCHLYLKELGLWPYFTVIITPEATINHKPHPEPAQKAMQELNQNQNILFLGDSEYDMICGRQAGTKIAFANWGTFAGLSLSLQPDFHLEEITQLIYA
jgi:pyrophosphatase PpaX